MKTPANYNFPAPLQALTLYTLLQKGMAKLKSITLAVTCDKAFSSIKHQRLYKL